jgi:hypothetical protein
MIEINLVPDVKQELIRAQRVRASVISFAILTGLVAVGVVVALAVWVFGVQTARDVITDNTIKSESQKLSAVQDVDTTLTIQNQLTKISETHNTKHITSRLFDILTTINPPEPNNVAITKLTLDTDARTVRVEAQASGYPALEVFKKTITATKLEYSKDGERQSIQLAANVSDSERSFGENASGAKVLRFTVFFEYSDDLLARASQSATIVAPDKKNVTDSLLGVPQSLFTERASDAGGNQ